MRISKIIAFLLSAHGVKYSNSRCAIYVVCTKISQSLYRLKNVRIFDCDAYVLFG